MIAGLMGLLFALGASPDVVWELRMDDGATDKAHGLVLGDGSVVIAGETAGDMLIYKLSLEGDSLWSTVYDYEGNEDIGYDAAVSPDGVMFVGGLTKESGGDFVTLVSAFSASEGLLWTIPLSNFHGYRGMSSLFCRHKDSCYVAGWCDLGIRIFLYLFKEDGSYTPLAVELISDKLNAFSGIDIDLEGSVYLSTSALEGIRLLKFDSKGTVPAIWARRYEGSPLLRGWQCKVAPNQDIYLCGEDSFDFLLLKWDPEGIRLWNTAKYYDLGAAEYCRDMALDSITDCYLTGWQAWGSEEDAALVKTDSAGNLLWAWVDTVPGMQEIEAIEVDNEGYIYLAGSSHNGADWDALVMKLRQPLTISGVVTDSLGKPMKSIPVAVSGDTTVEVNTDNEGSYTITIYNGGNYTLKPNLAGYTFEPPQREYAPLAYRMWDQDFENGRWTAVAEQPVAGAVTLEVRGAAVFFSIPANLKGTLKIYDSSGQLVQRMAVQGQSSIDLTRTLSSGVYFVKLETEKTNITRKAIVLK